MADKNTPSTIGKEVFLVASGDLRLSANQKCWPAQQEMEQTLGRSRRRRRLQVVRAHPNKPDAGHGFIASPAGRHEGLPRDRPDRAADRRRGGLAILASRAGRAHRRIAARS